MQNPAQQYKPMASSQCLIYAIVLLHAVCIANVLRPPENDGTDCSEDISSSEVVVQPVGQEDAGCTDCASQKENLTEDEVNQLRIEMAKQQILEKLHMTRPPCRSLPKPPLQPLLEAADMLDNATEQEEEEEAGEAEFGSRVKSIVLYPVSGDRECLRGQDQPCSRYQFRYRRDTSPGHGVRAELWLYKRSAQDALQVSELVPRSSGRVRRRDVAQQSAGHSARLVKFQLPASTTWSESAGFRQLDLEVSCQSGCGDGPAVSGDRDEQPFLIVNFSANRSSSRSRRSIDCVEGSSFCCRKSLTLSFQEVGWDNWIIAPAGYEVNFCWGRCFSADTNTKYHHTTMLNSFIERNKTAVQQLGLKMCCTPSKMSSLNILYRDGNGNIVKAELQDMKVEACKCA